MKVSVMKATATETATTMKAAAAMKTSTTMKTATAMKAAAAPLRPGAAGRRQQDCQQYKFYRFHNTPHSLVQRHPQSARSGLFGSCRDMPTAAKPHSSIAGLTQYESR